MPLRNFHLQLVPTLEVDNLLRKHVRFTPSAFLCGWEGEVRGWVIGKIGVIAASFGRLRGLQQHDAAIW